MAGDGSSSSAALSDDWSFIWATWCCGSRSKEGVVNQWLFGVVLNGEEDEDYEEEEEEEEEESQLNKLILSTTTILVAHWRRPPG